MRVDGSGRSSKVGKGGSAKRSGGSGEAFVVDSGSPASQAAGASSASSVSGIDAILALQAVDDPLFGKRKAVKRGVALLDALEEVKADILAGRVNASVLMRMTKLLETGKSRNDPDLDALLADIELRARVELAKLGHFPKF